MKFVHHLFINTLITLNLIVTYEYFIVEPRLSKLGHIVAVEAGNRIDIDKKLIEIESDINEQKNLTNTRTGNFVQRISKLENRNALLPTIDLDIKTLKNSFFDLSDKIEKLEKLLLKTKSNE